MKRNAKGLRKYKEVCKKIWEERVVCGKCGKYIREPKYSNFHHVNGRRTEELLLDPDNILFCCTKCHAHEHGIEMCNADWLDY